MEKENNFNFEDIVYRITDEIKFLLSPDKWNTALLDCSKNEILTLFFLYRMKSVNMSEIAEYINSPLNTVTGVVNRLEKKHFITRERDTKDKRVVKIALTKSGENLFKDFLNEAKMYFNEIYKELSEEEKLAAISIIGKAISVLKKDNKNLDRNESSKKKVKRIKIE